MKRLLVYSHDTFGLGNIRRMLAICEHLIDTEPDLSILLITGSPVIHNLRLPERLDYIKLPCLTRCDYEGYGVKYLDAGIDETIRLRSDLILSAVASFKPDVFLIDKKPYGVKNELLMALNYARLHLPGSRSILVLRDILDSSQRTRSVWKKNGYDDAIRLFYNHVAIMGSPEIFDPCMEYGFSNEISDKASYCGYLRRKEPVRPRHEVRNELQAADDEFVALVTPGGGQDGFDIISTYFKSLDLIPADTRLRSVIVCGPEMEPYQKELLYRTALHHPQATILEFTPDLMSLMNASDVIVSMGGYNTVCELLSLNKRALVIPRVRPTEEQLIRAERMSARGLVRFIHPDELTPINMSKALLNELSLSNVSSASFPRLNMDALSNLNELISPVACTGAAPLTTGLIQRQIAAGSLN